MQYKSFSDAREATLQQHSSQKVKWTLACSYYHEDKERKAAVEMASTILAAGRRLWQVRAADDSNSPQKTWQFGLGRMSEELVAHKRFTRMLVSNKNVFAESRECWRKFDDQNKPIACDYNYTFYQKLQYFSNISLQVAQTSFFVRVAHNATMFQQAVQMMNQEYHSPPSQTKVKNILVI